MKPSLQLIPERSVVCQDRQTTLSVLVRACAPRAEVVKPKLNVGICIDRSGSMHGAPIERAKQAARHIVDHLESTDLISVVAFSDITELLTASREVGASAHRVNDRLARLNAHGSTALHEGWVESAHQVQRGARRGRLSRVVLLSDGEANTGLTDPASISAEVAEWARRGISTTAIGLGEAYNEDLLAAMARAGNGNFYHVRTPHDILSTFQVELAGLFAAFASEVSFGVHCRGGVRLLRVVNPLEPSREGRWNVADLSYGHPVELVLEFLVPAMAGESELCVVDLRWTDLQTGQLCESSRSLRLPVAPHGQLSEFPLHREVSQKKALQEAACLTKDAVQLMGGCNAALAAGKLREATDALSPFLEAPEARRAVGELQQLLADLERGQEAHARKQASSYYSSSSISSIVISGVFQEFMALPENERTPERLKTILGRDLAS